MKDVKFEEAWQDLRGILEKEPMVYTLAQKRPNVVISVSEEAIEVRTQRSSPQSHPVPKWMFERAFDYLVIHGSLLNQTLLNELNVKRSAFVMAALSKLPYINHTKDPLKIFLTK